VTGVPRPRHQAQHWAFRPDLGLVTPRNRATAARIVAGAPFLHARNLNAKARPLRTRVGATVAHALCEWLLMHVSLCVSGRTPRAQRVPVIVFAPRALAAWSWTENQV